MSKLVKGIIITSIAIPTSIVGVMVVGKLIKHYSKEGNKVYENVIEN